MTTLDATALVPYERPMAAITAKGQKAVERILDAAEVVVAREGHAGATTRRIAAEAGVDKRVLSYYFDSREALLAEVISRTAARVAQTVGLALHASPERRHTARTVLDVVWAGITSEPALARAYVAILGSDGHGAQMATAIERMNVMYAGLLRGALRDLGHDERSARRLAGVMTVVVRGLLLSWVEGADLALIDDTLDVAAAALTP